MRTDYKDFIASTENRHYRQIDNDDGTISLVDETVYTQEGDKVSAGVLNELSQNAIWPLQYAKSGTTHQLTGLTAVSGVVSCVFTATADFAEGDTFTVDGETYAVQLSSGEPAENSLFVSGATVAIVIDKIGKKVNFKSGGGGYRKGDSVPASAFKIVLSNKPETALSSIVSLSKSDEDAPAAFMSDPPIYMPGGQNGRGIHPIPWLSQSRSAIRNKVCSSVPDDSYLFYFNKDRALFASNISGGIRLQLVDFAKGNIIVQKKLTGDFSALGSFCALAKDGKSFVVRSDDTGNVGFKYILLLLNENLEEQYRVTIEKETSYGISPDENCCYTYDKGFFYGLIPSKSGFSQLHKIGATTGDITRLATTQIDSFYATICFFGNFLWVVSATAAYKFSVSGNTATMVEKATLSNTSGVSEGTYSTSKFSITENALYITGSNSGNSIVAYNKQGVKSAELDLNTYSNITPYYLSRGVFDFNGCFLVDSLSNLFYVCNIIDSILITEV